MKKLKMTINLQVNNNNFINNNNFKKKQTQKRNFLQQKVIMKTIINLNNLPLAITKTRQNYADKKVAE